MRKLAVHYETLSAYVYTVQATEKLVVFLLGVVSHQVADVLWHSLGIQQGFLQAMAAVSVYGILRNKKTGIINPEVLHQNKTEKK